MKTFAVGAGVKSHFFAVYYFLQFDCGACFASSFEFFLFDASSDNFMSVVPVAHVVLVKFAHNKKTLSYFCGKVNTKSAKSIKKIIVEVSAAISRV